MCHVPCAVRAQALSELAAAEGPGMVCEEYVRGLVNAATHSDVGESSARLRPVRTHGASWRVPPFTAACTHQPAAHHLCNTVSCMLTAWTCILLG